MSNRYSLGRTTRLRYSWLLLVAFLFSYSSWAQVTATVGSGTTTATNVPVSTNWGFNYSQQIYTAAQINGAIAPISGPQTITQLAFFYNTSVPSTIEWASWDIYLGNTAQSSFSSTTNWIPAASLTQVFSGNVTVPAAGNWMTITLTTPFLWDGTSNLVVAVDENTPGFANANAGWGTFASGTNTGMYFRSDSTNPNPATPPTASLRVSSINRIQIQIPSPPECTAITNGGSVSPASLSACSGASFTLNVTGATADNPGGVSFQWQSSTNGVDFTNISGQTGASLTTSITSATWFRRLTICAAGSSELPSTAVQVTLNSLLNCYCAPTYSSGCSAGSDAITNVVLGTLSNASGCAATPFYTYNTVATTTLQKGVSYTLNVTMGGDGSQFAAAWIDWNANGTLESGENIGFNTVNAGANGTASFNFTVPLTAVETLTRLRIRGGNDSALNAGQACGASSSGFGETEDYDVTIAPAPSCLPPTALTASSITTSSASLSWAAGGTETTWNIEWGVAPFAQGAGTLVSGVTNPFTLSSLTANTAYAYYVQADCGSSTTSSWAGPFTFSTLCSNVTTFPFNETFETSSSTRSCWNTSDFVLGTTPWTYGAGSPSGGGITTAQQGSANARLYFTTSGGGATTRLVSPSFDMSSLTAPQLVFYYATPEWFGDQDELRVYYRTSATGTWTLIPTAVYTTNVAVWTEVTLDLPAASNDYYIAFEGVGNFGRGALVDNVTVRETPSCPQPVAGVALNIAATSAEVNWTEVGTGTNWDIEYGPTGFIQGSPAGILVEDITTLPYEISGLTPGTAYDVYYRTDCGGSQSAWSGPISFTTAPGCGSTWTDTGGASANYAINEDYVITVCPDTPGEVVSANFSAFSVEDGYDYMLIYNGATTSDPLIPSGLPAGAGAGIFGISPANAWTGTLSPGFITSTAVSGCLTFRFVSDDFINTAGWVAAFSCDVPPTCGVPSVSGVTPSFDAVSFTINASATGTPVGYEYEIVADLATPTGTGTPSATNTITAGGLTASTAYDLYVRTNCGVDGFSDWFGPVSFTTLPTPPVNFNCANAIPISCATPLVSGTTVNALLDPNYVDAGAGGTAPQRGVWYTIVGDDNAYTINTCSATGFDSRLSVYTGSCGALVGLVGNDDMNALCSISGVRSQVTFNAEVGTTYYVYVHSFSTFTQAAFELNVSCAPLCPAPANDACASAQVLTQAPTCSPVTGTTTCATPTLGLANPFFGGSPFSTINDVWYTFTATEADGYFLFDNVSAEGLYYTIYFEDPCGGSELGESGAQGDVIPGEQLPFIGAVVGDTYWLRINVDPTVPGAADGSFDLCVVSLPCATPVTVDAVATSGTNIEVTHDGIDGETYIIEYGPAGFTPGDAGTAGIGGTIVSTTTLVTNVTVASGTYDFYVRKDCSGAAEGYSLNQFGGTVTTPPANDNCEDAILISCSSGSVTGTNVGATTSPGETTESGFTTNNAVWYTLIGDGSQVTLSTCGGATYDNYIRVYSGSCGNYTNVTAGDDNCGSQAQVTFSAAVGTTYYILVSGFGQFSAGPFTMTVSCVAPPANDNCATAQAITCGSSVTGTTVAANTSTGETTPGVWYSIVGDGSTITASTCGGATWNTFLQVYTGPCGGPYTSIASNDNACGNQSTVSWLSTVGETYYVLVRGVGTANGTFTLTTTCQNICTTIQNPGAVLGPNTICSGVSFTLNATNINVGTVYQWQRRTAGTNWANIAGATSSSLTTSQTVATEYRVRIGCNNSGLNSISSVLAVAMTPFLDCFCTPTTGSNTSGDFIAALNFGSISNNSGVNPSVYTSYTAAQHTTTILRGGQHSGTFTVGTWSTNNVGIWIDFNRDGTFQSTERVYNNTTNLAGNSTTPFTVNVPLNASLGTTKMRIRKNDVTAGGPAIDPCAAYSWTETEDYVITIANGSVNDSRANATVVNPANFPSCSNLSGNLANATPSATGEGNDLWYSFTAESNGVRIQLTGSGDNLIELEDAAGNTIETQNTAGGSEILANGSLTPGAQYFVAVRNVTGPASFTVCIQTLAQSTCDNGPVFTSLCNVFKADWTGTANYVATFTETAAPFNVYVGNLNGTTSLPLRNVAGLAHGRSYNVRVDAVYTIGSETITVQGDGLCTITITQHPFTNLRTIDAAPNTRTIGAFIGTDVLICGNTDYEWSFELVDELNNPIGIEGPVSVFTGSNSRYIRTSQIPGVSAGNRYRVRVRPIFGAEPGVFDDGTFRYLQITSSAGMVDAFDGEVAPEAVLFERNTENGVFAALYPNPNNGDMVNLNIAGLDSESVQVRIFDATGRVVFSNRYVVEGALNTIVSFDNPLTSGMYIVEMTFGKEVITERMMVSK